MKETDSGTELDLIWGAKAIAKEMNAPERRVYYMLERRKIPAKKIGTLWVASRKGLRAHFAEAFETGGAE